MFKNSEILFAIGTLGAIISFILLLIGVINKVKKLKIILIILICIFVVIFATGTALAYNYYEVTSQINERELNTKIISGSSSDPIVITEKTFYEDDTYYYSEFEINNNTNIEISKISFHIMFTDKDTQANTAHDEHIFLLDSVIPPNQTVTKNYIWKKNYSTKESAVTNAKLIKIQNIVCYATINGEEKSIKLEDLKATLNNMK